ncbi:hypothetical protein [Bacteroides sp.]|uniref:hypothetical protein n=1 Tax=Bacteroides sp. TaxID=29523 RepID=UPI0026092E19|nr:hypothetical protein [Bacteroides sp.]MDD3040178.1 hypothetical protein [Bacteroides sp.]
MKFSLYLCITCFILFSTSCRKNNQRGINSQNKTTDYIEAIPTTKSALEGDTMLYNALYPTGICIVDTFLLIAQHKDKNLIHVYSLNDTTFLGCFLNKGGGPNEVAIWSNFTQVWKENDGCKILIQSYPTFIAILNLEQSLKEGKAVFDSRDSYETGSNHDIMLSSNIAYRINNDTILFNRAPQRIKDCNNYNIFGTLYDIKQKKEIKSFQYTNLPSSNYFLLYSGRTALHPKQTKICFAGSFLNIISITDLKTGELLQIFPDGEKTNIDKIVSQMEDQSYYQDCLATDDRIILLSNKGQSNTSLFEEKYKSYLEIYDWNGKHHHSLIIPESIYYIALDSRKGHIYAILEDGGVKRYNINSFL